MSMTPDELVTRNDLEFRREDLDAYMESRRVTPIEEIRRAC